ncbi:MAG TPA: Fe-S cluster assembly ATPase SufC [Candidatus Colwellbacteria bacterium]|nr:Fe-S cluster assembly ATPase SufC [Candidatus Colwellbacteria bacterium]
MNLSVSANSIHVLMGQNGSGKSTLAQTIMGNPFYEPVAGKIEFEGVDILGLKPDERSKKGIFLSFQYPSEVAGVGIQSFLRILYNNSHEEKLTPVRFRELLFAKSDMLGINREILERSLNDGFSGGEKKKMEILQMSILEPKLAILDEVDSGLDIDSLKIVANAVDRLRKKNNMAVLIITHYARILKYLEPDFVHVMKDGRIAKSGNRRLAYELEERGYEFDA